MIRREKLARQTPGVRIVSARPRSRFREYAPPELIDMGGEEEVEAEECAPRHLRIVSSGEAPHQTAPASDGDAT